MHFLGPLAKLAEAERFLEYLGEKLLGVASVFGGVSFSLNLTHSKSVVRTHAVFWEVSIGERHPL